MDSTSPVTARTAGDHSSFAPTVHKFLFGLVIRFTLWFGRTSPDGAHRRSDQTPSPTLAP